RAPRAPGRDSAPGGPVGASRRGRCSPRGRWTNRSWARFPASERASDGAGAQFPPLEAVREGRLQQPAGVVELPRLTQALTRQRDERATAECPGRLGRDRHQALGRSELVVGLRLDAATRLGIRCQIEPVTELLQQSLLEQPQGAVERAALLEGIERAVIGIE